MLGAMRNFIRRLFQPIVSAQYFTGIRLYNMGNYKEAGDAFGLIRAGIYRASVLYNRLSDFYFYRAQRNAAIISFYQHDHVRTIKFCQQAFEVAPDDTVCRNYLAHAFHNVGQYGAAIKQLEKLSTLEPDRVDVLFNLAKINIKADRTREGRKILSDLITRDMEFADFYHIRGIAYGKEGNLEKAIANFKQAVEINPRFANAILLLGLAQVRALDYHAAHDTLKTGVDRCPDNTNMLFYYAHTKKIIGWLGDEPAPTAPEKEKTAHTAVTGRKIPKEVRDDIDYLGKRVVEEHYRMLELDISFGEHFTFLDPIYDKPCLRGLIEVFESFVSSQPTFADFYLKLGTFYMKLGEEEKAENNYKKSLELNPGYIKAMENLSDLYESEDRLAEALGQTNSILALQPDDPKILITQGRLYAKLGEPEQAVEAMITATRHDRLCAYHLYLLGQMLFEDGKLELAGKCWLEVQDILPGAARNLKRLRRKSRFKN